MPEGSACIGTNCGSRNWILNVAICVCCLVVKFCMASFVSWTLACRQGSIASLSGECTIKPKAGRHSSEIGSLILSFTSTAKGKKVVLQLGKQVDQVLMANWEISLCQ